MSAESALSSTPCFPLVSDFTGLRTTAGTAPVLIVDRAATPALTRPESPIQYAMLAQPGITSVKQLKGKKVGIPGWLNTCGLWVRGILSEEYGVKASDIHWITSRPHKMELSLPAGTRIDVVPSEQSLTQRMLRGEFDAIVVPWTLIW